MPDTTTTTDSRRDDLVADVQRAIAGHPVTYRDDNGYEKLSVGSMAERLARQRLAEYDSGGETDADRAERELAESIAARQAERAALLDQLPALDDTARKAYGSAKAARRALAEAVAADPVVAAYIAFAKANDAHRRAAGRAGTIRSEARRQSTPYTGEAPVPDGAVPTPQSITFADVVRGMIQDLVDGQ